MARGQSPGTTGIRESVWAMVAALVVVVVAVTVWFGV